MKLISRYDRNKQPKAQEYRSLTREEILALHNGSHVQCVGKDGRVADVKINGAVRTWKRDPDRVEVPCKYGMYEYFTLSLTEAMSMLVVPDDE
jgi:hypothetical protein